jgi:plastocyanin domain-containing protein
MQDLERFSMKRWQLIITTIVAITLSSIFAYAEEPIGEKRFVAQVNANGVQEVSIIGGEYYFDPNYIVVKVNVPVELTVTKTKGFIPHDIVVKAPDAGIDFTIDLSAKEPRKVRFTPTRAGRYDMTCDKKFLFFKSHKEKGMKGIIEVVP